MTIRKRLDFAAAVVIAFAIAGAVAAGVTWAFGVVNRALGIGW
jgi:hypothetical protein